MPGGTTPLTGTQQVAVAGTRVEIIDPAQAAGASFEQVTIQALATNTGVIVVGDANVVAAAGTHASPTVCGIALTAGQSITLPLTDPARLWIDATVSADGVSFLGITQ